MSYRAVQHGLKSVEVPIHFAERSAGESKMSLGVQLESALLPFQLRLRAARNADRKAGGGELEHQGPERRAG
jgi:dolichol-phosphate mannosyltransferase